MSINALPSLRSATRALLAVTAALAAGLGLAEESRLTVSAGALYTTGDYGGEQSIDESYVPVTAGVDWSRVALRVTVPFLSVRAPEQTSVVGPDGEVIVGEGDLVTESGLGDIVASVTLYDVLVSRSGNLVMDLTGKVKFGTADETVGLGTGEEDYSLQADVFSFHDRLTAIGTVGYALRGDPAGYELDDTLFASIGGSYVVTDAASLGLFFDYRESALPGEGSLRELSASGAFRVGEHSQALVYLLTGFSDGSPDWGAGLSLLASF
ncbi:MAG TPA: hypothetical protein VLT59_10880 [Steroidobacteraceae bacterium]|nr:hypothetical protein [Steroidobacteraceae bacterium]